MLFASIKNCAAQVNTIPGLVLWINGDSVQTSGGNFINKCYDLSPSNNHPVQVVAANQPTLNPIGLNGHKSISFDGVNDYIIFNEISDIRTVFVVQKESSSGPGLAPLLGHSSAFDFHSGGSTIPWTSGFTSNDIINGITRVNFTQINGLTTPLNYQNNIISLVTLGNVKADNFSNDRIVYGRVWAGELSELIIYNTALTPAQVLNIEKYLLDKYTPTLNLGPDIIVSQVNGCVPTNSITIQANPNFQSYLWSNGNPTNQINVNQYGEYSVIATDVFGIQHYDTIKVTPTQKNFNYPSQQILCQNEIITWNTLLDTTLHNFQWQDNSTDSLFIITSPGQYFVTVTDTFGCAYTSNTLTVTQDNFPTIASLGPDVSLCSGNAITLISGANQAMSYLWNDLSTNNSLTINNAGQYSVIVTNTNNCIAEDTINISIQGLAPMAGFFNQVACKNNAVSFTDNSIAPAGNSINKWDWDFGDATTLADTSHQQNPFYTFSDTGLYTVSLTVYTDVGCKQTLLKTIHVYPKPVVNFNNIIACKNDSALFTSTITTFNYPIFNYNWNFGDLASGTNNISSLPNPKHSFSQQTTYSVTFSATNIAGCSSTLTNTIAVRAEVKADFNYTTPCTNGLITFQDNSIVPNPNVNNIRHWNFGSSTSNNLTVTKQYTLSGIYSVTLTVNGINSCNSTVVKQINVMKPPLVAFNATNLCSKDTIAITDLSAAQNGSISLWNWRLDNVNFSSVQNPTLSITSAANHTVQLTAINSFGCKDSVKNTLIVFPLPVVSFSTNPPQYIYTSIPVTFLPNITGGNYYNWDIQSAGNYTVQSPTVSFTNTGTYSVTLVLKDNNNCKGTKNSVVNVLNRYLDLGILDTRSIKNSSNYMSVEVDLANFGSMPITSFDINYQINNGGNVIETWNGVLNSGNFFTYQFNAKTLINSIDPDEITCVTIQSVNGTTDANTSNNNFCKASNTDNISVLNPYPNPTDNNITLPVILNRDSEYTIQLFDALGQIIMEERIEKGTMGLNLIKIQTDNYRRGCYFLKITINDKIYLKKFIKNSGY